jgi:predicted transposase YdaD
MTLAEQLILKGRQEGRQEGELKGRQEGRQEGEYQGYRKLVRRQIELKFGALDADALARLDAADETKLVRYGDRVLTATSIEDVLRD